MPNGLLFSCYVFNNYGFNVQHFSKNLSISIAHFSDIKIRLQVFFFNLLLDGTGKVFIFKFISDFKIYFPKS